MTSGFATGCSFMARPFLTCALPVATVLRAFFCTYFLAFFVYLLSVLACSSAASNSCLPVVSASRSRSSLLRCASRKELALVPLGVERHRVVRVHRDVRQHTRR